LVWSKMMGSGGFGSLLRHLRRAAALGEGTVRTDGELLECYLTRRDETAFESLLRRHGPMVLGVCRRILGNEADAHDAFQATFLVFVRKASTILPRARVGNWLYGVAHRTALKARATNQLRRTRERRVPIPPTAPVDDGVQEVLATLDEALCRLPTKYRTAIVLCHLQELTLQEAARQLGCPPGTVASRLARARVMLAQRLARSGVSVAGGALATALARGAAPVPVPSALLASTTAAATAFAAGKAVAASAVSTGVAQLTQGVLTGLAITKWKIVATILVTGALAGGGVLLLARTFPGVQATEAERNASATEVARGDPDRDALEGTWTLVSGERGGREMPPEILSTWGRLVFTADTVTREGTEPKRGTYSINPSRRPREIDLFTDSESVRKGIYEIKQGVLRLALTTRAERPREFTSRDVQLLVLEKR
jgi:RNA polymerase sigma-70 factor (ECF subfamily)